MIGDHKKPLGQRGHDEHPFVPYARRIVTMNTEDRVKLSERVVGTIGAIAMLAGFEHDQSALITGGLVGVALSVSSAVLRKFH